MSLTLHPAGGFIVREDGGPQRCGVSLKGAVGEPTPARDVSASGRPLHPPERSRPPPGALGWDLIQAPVIGIGSPSSSGPPPDPLGAGSGGFRCARRVLV